MTSDTPRRDGLGIVVVGYNRPHHLQSVLESLRQQGKLDRTHVWIDGTQGRGEHLRANDHTVRIAKRYSVAGLHVQNGHMGIEKLMLDALGAAITCYDRVIVLEDDCFPTDHAIEQFEEGLAAVAGRNDVYSVYGHPFLTEGEGDQLSRFQGWGWAAHSRQIEQLLPALRDLFMMPEDAYLAHIANSLTPEITARLDVTPGRDVVQVLQRFFPWDSATSFLCAQRGLVHRKTKARSIFNTGIVSGIGHFREDSERFRLPPFNLITVAEAWDHFDTRTPPCPNDKASYGLDQLDILIRDALPIDTGFFVEIGAHDRVKQNNSLILEAAVWTGMLIEAVPAQYAKCVKARPNCIVEHAACVAADVVGSHIVLTDVGLMSLGANSRIAGEVRQDWLRRGEGFANRRRQNIEVPTATLSGIFDRHGVTGVDLLILDVEGAEVDVLKGIDFARHAPRFIVAEDAYDEHVATYLATHRYARDRILLERKFTRDGFYSRPS